MRLQFACPTCGRKHHKEVVDPRLTLAEKTALCGCDPTRQPPPGGATRPAPPPPPQRAGKQARITELGLLPESGPTKRSSHPAVVEAVLGDFLSHDHDGKVEYGHSLAPFEGTDRGIDLYEALLDAVLFERARRIEQMWYFIVEGDPVEFLLSEARDAESKGSTLLVAWLDGEIRRVGHLTSASFAVQGTVKVSVVPQGVDTVLDPQQAYAIRRIQWPATGPSTDEVNRVEFTTEEEATLPVEPARELALT